ncbi:transcriptional regulator [Streptomyces sp. NBC_01590]|uniref:transcriptional regulator n=1 Tax=Streptomyces sp. NBC_01590 TaxID=2975887 RepID=UPI003866BD8E
MPENNNRNGHHEPHRGPFALLSRLGRSPRPDRPARRLRGPRPRPDGPARLHYLTKTDHSLAAAKDADLTVTDRTLRAWLEGTRRPSKASLERIDAAYWTVRRRNVARHLLARLNREGRGTRVEFHPLNQSQVAGPLQRVVEYRTMNVRRWDRIVEAWATGDHQGLDDEWTTDVLPDLGFQWGRYEYVTNIGFAA